MIHDVADRIHGPNNCYIIEGAGAPLFEENAGQRFFIEAGAFDGAFLSNSLYLEMKHNWTGLLVRTIPMYKGFTCTYLPI